MNATATASPTLPPELQFLKETARLKIEDARRKAAEREARERQDNLDALVATAIGTLGLPLYGRFQLRDEEIFDRNTVSATFVLRLPGHAPISCSFERDSRGTWTRTRMPIATHGLGRNVEHAQWQVLPEGCRSIYVCDLGEALLFAEEGSEEGGEDEGDIPF